MFCKIISFIIPLAFSIGSSVNFSIETEDEFGAVWVTGSFDGWTGWGLELSQSNNLWTGSMSLPNGDYEYVILGVDTSIPNWWNDIWNNSIIFNAPIGSECDFLPNDEWANYGFSINNSDVVLNYCAGTCQNSCSSFNGYPTTFTVDMSNIEIQTGDNNYPAVFIVGQNEQLNGPNGIEMVEINDNRWQITVNLLPGTYTYKFRNGYYDYWDSPGWESISGFCATGEWNDRQLTVSNNNQVLDEVCFNSCTECNTGPEEYVLVWSDEFNGNEIDLNKWTFEIGNGNWGWGNGEHQYYTSRSENAFIEEGNLVIQALYENYNGYNYTSARMKTVNQGDWVYGKIKARIKVPSGNGTWPAFWMMPTNSVYGGWPHSGEIDIMEHYGCDNLENHPEATVHNSTYNWNGGIPPTSYEEFIATATSEFHDYELEWTESELKFSINGNWIGSYYNNNSGWQQWPYNQEFYIILNLAIGSHFMSCETENNLFPQRYEIDYVRVYQLQNTEYIDLYGDINLDGILNIIDVIMMVDFIIGNAIATNFEFLILDINTDSNLDILDVIQLVELIL